MFEEKFSTICKLLYKHNIFDSLKCNGIALRFSDVAILHYVVALWEIVCI